MGPGEMLKGLLHRPEFSPEWKDTGAMSAVLVLPFMKNFQTILALVMGHGSAPFMRAACYK